MLKLAFALFRYFPHGGLQRDFIRIADECLQRGHNVTVYTTAWEGEMPEGWDVRLIAARGWSNHQRIARFARDFARAADQESYDLRVGFNKMPGLDVYYAADPCYVERAARQKSALYRCTGRYRTYAAMERSVFGADETCKLLMIAEPEIEHFIKHYRTSPERFVLLPPGISRDRVAGQDADKQRAEVRQALGLDGETLMLLQVGSAFKTKGLDRSLEALAALPLALRDRTRLYVAGRGDKAPFARQAESLGIAEAVVFLGPRDDVPALLLGADLLVHPAYTENTGTVLLEAMAAGLPVLTTGNCGYAAHVQAADGGLLVPMPFRQTDYGELLMEMLSTNDLRSWGRRGHAYVLSHDVFSMPEKAVDEIEAAAGARS